MKHTKDILIISSLFIGLAIALTYESSSKDNYNAIEIEDDDEIASSSASIVANEEVDSVLFFSELDDLPESDSSDYEITMEELEPETSDSQTESSSMEGIMEELEFESEYGKLLLENSYADMGQYIDYSTGERISILPSVFTLKIYEKKAIITKADNSCIVYNFLSEGKTGTRQYRFDAGETKLDIAFNNKDNLLSAITINKKVYVGFFGPPSMLTASTQQNLMMGSNTNPYIESNSTNSTRSLCSYCNGSGKCSWDTNLAYGKYYCRGSRKCQYCYGKGWNYNPYGSGIIKCSACNNTGDCSYCRGTGVCSKCGGRKYQY